MGVTVGLFLLQSLRQLEASYFQTIAFKDPTDCWEMVDKMKQNSAEKWHISPNLELNSDVTFPKFKFSPPSLPTTTTFEHSSPY